MKASYDIGGVRSRFAGAKITLIQGKSKLRLHRQLLLSLLVALIFIGAVFAAKDWPLQARLFPWVIGFPMILLALIQVVFDVRGPNISGGEVGNGPGAESTRVQEMSPTIVRRRTINIFGWIFGFFGLIWLLGFNIAVPLVVFLYLKVQSSESWPLSLMCTGAAYAFVWGVFDRLLHLPLEEGVVPAWISSLMS